MSAKAQSEWEAHAALGAANGGDFLQACEIAIRAFETYPGAQWDRDQLRDLSTEITDRWIRNLSRDEKTYLRTLVANAESPVGIWMRCLLD